MFSTMGFSDKIETYIFSTIALCLLQFLPKNITTQQHKTNKNLEEVDLVKEKGGHVSFRTLASL